MTMQKEEQVYLISSWSLYSKVPPPMQIDIAAKVHRAGDRYFDPPRYMDDLQGIVFDVVIDYNHSLIHPLRELVAAIRTDNAPAIAAARRQIEINFIESPVVYEVIEVRFDPVERWRSGEIIEETNIATLSSETYD